MANVAIRVYWDSNLFRDFISGHPEHAADVEALLEQADTGKLEIITSAISVAEVAFAQQERSTGLLSAEVEERIDKLWVPPSPVKLVEFHFHIARRARQLLRQSLQRGWKGLRAFDAVHLCTAQLYGVTELHTYDAGLERYSELIGVKVGAPFVEQIRLLLEPPKPKPPTDAT